MKGGKGKGDVGSGFEAAQIVRMELTRSRTRRIGRAGSTCLGGCARGRGCDGTVVGATETRDGKRAGDIRWEQDAAATSIEFAVGRMGFASRATGGVVGQGSGGIAAGVEAADGATAVASCELDALDTTADAINVVEGVDKGGVV